MAVQGDRPAACVRLVTLGSEDLGALRVQVQQAFADEIVDRTARGEGGVQPEPGLRPLFTLGEFSLDMLRYTGVKWSEGAGGE